jgi:Uma2 family endonuclease
MVGPNDMQPARAASLRLTYDDYAHFPDDGQRHELIDGEHVVTPAPAFHHQRVSGRLFFALESYLRAHPVGILCFAPMDVILSDFDVVQPDLLFVSNERREVLGKWVHGAPDLAVEIVSPSSRRNDEVTKRRLFERVNVVEYWIVDPEVETVKIYRRADDGGFPRVAEFARESGAALTSALFPGFSLDLAELFAEDRRG